MRSIFFDSEQIGVDELGNPIYDRPNYTADLRKSFASLIGNGIYPNPSTEFQVYALEGMNVTVKPGRTWIEGAFGWEEDETTLSFAAADTQSRKDRVVLRLDLSKEQRNIALYVLQGTPAANPAAPELTRDDTVYELGLADILIPYNSTAIAQQNITDTRLNNDLCGLVSGMVTQIDTTTLYEQIQSDLANFQNMEQAEFEAWFAELQEKLSGDVAASLQAQVDELGEGLEAVEEVLPKKLDDTTKYAASSSVGGNATTADKVANALTISFNGTSQGAYNGSAAKTVNITPAAIGGAAASHNHSAANITSGTLAADRLPTVPITKGGTGATTAAAARTNLGVAASSHTHSYLPLSGGSLTGRVNSTSDVCCNNTSGCSSILSATSLMGCSGNFKVGMPSNSNLGAYNLHLTALSANYPIKCTTWANNSSYVPIYASAFTQQSSRKFKENIEDMTVETANKLYELNPVSFDYINGNKNAYGLIAEEVESIYPNTCIYEGKEGDETGKVELTGLDYTKFIPFMIKCIQEQKKEIEQNKADIAELKELVNKIMSTQ